MKPRFPRLSVANRRRPDMARQSIVCSALSLAAVRRTGQATIVLQQQQQRRLASNFFPTSPPAADPDVRSPPPPKPPTKTWFTGRPEYNDAIDAIQDALHRTRNHLFRAGVLDRYEASPADALAKLNLPVPVRDDKNRPWKSSDEISAMLETRLKMLHYRRISQLLSSLDALKPHAKFADKLGPPYSDGSLETEIEAVLEPFRRQLTAAQKTSMGESRLWKIDEHGRAYAVGRRKESSARVWVIPVKRPSTLPSQQQAEGDSIQGDSPQSEPPIGEILVNGRPLVDAFDVPYHRTSIVQPFTATHTLGAYNVFAIARGGGKTGQADAIALGIARCLFGLLEDKEKRSILWGGECPRDQILVLMC
jgi:small subunit ribosomal protein S9